jgi:hypothetical protein
MKAMSTSPNAVYDPSPATLRPLMDMFWSAQGWRLPEQLPPAPVLSQAITAGVMFDQPRVHDHDGWIDAARRAAASVSVDEVGDAFLESMMTRRLDLRSALGSYAVARLLPEHDFAGTTSGCGVCGQYSQPDEDLNAFSFERFKWGGVRRDDIRYVAFDLEQFTRAPRRGATDADRSIGRELVDTLRHLPDNITASQAAPRLNMVKGNKAERETILDILGVCGILQTPDHHGYHHRFVPVTQRDDPPQRFVERTYPVSWWKGRDGVNDGALRTFLPSLG